MGTGIFNGGITGTTGYFANTLTIVGTSYIGGGMTATTGYFSNLLNTNGGITGTTSYYSGTSWLAGGVTSTTGYFNNSLTVTGTGIFNGGITGTTGTFGNSLSILNNGGINMYDSGSANYLTINVPTFTPNFTMTLPPNMGSTGYFLRNIGGTLGFLDNTQPAYESRFVDDFRMGSVTAPYGDVTWTVNTAGGASTSASLFNAYTGWGVVSITAGNSAGAYYNISMSGYTYQPSASEQIIIEAGVQIPSNYTSTGPYTIGFGNSRTTVSDTQGVYFSCITTSTGLNGWYGVCVGTAGTTTGSTGTGVSTGSFQRLLISGNTTAGYTFTVGNTSLGTITTTLPSSGMYPIIRNWNTSGAFTKLIYLDYFRYSRFNSSVRY